MSRRWQRAGTWRGPVGVSGCASCQPRRLFPEASGSEFLAAHTGAARGASATRSASLHGNSYAGEGARAFPPAAAAIGSAPAWRAPRDTPLPSPRPHPLPIRRGASEPSHGFLEVFQGFYRNRKRKGGEGRREKSWSPLPGRGESLHRVLSRMVARYKSVRADAARKGSSSPSSRSISSFPTNPPHLHLQSSSPLPAIESTLA